MTFAQWNPQQNYIGGDTVQDGIEPYVALSGSTAQQPSVSPLFWTLFNPPATPVVDSLNGLTNVVVLAGGSGVSVSQVAQTISVANTGVLSVDGAAGALTTKAGQYYLTSAQNLTSGNTDVLFQDQQTWSDTTAINWTGPSANFTVAVKGLYQLEFNALVSLNAAALSATSNRTIGIDITRSPSAETAVIQTSSFTAAGLNYALSTGGSIALDVGDGINCRLGVTFTGGPPTAQPSTGFDANTFFTWTLIKPLP